MEVKGAPGRYMNHCWHIAGSPRTHFSEVWIKIRKFCLRNFLHFVLWAKAVPSADNRCTLDYSVWMSWFHDANVFVTVVPEVAVNCSTMILRWSCGFVIWKLLPYYWPFVRGIHRWPVVSPQKEPVKWTFGVSFFPDRTKLSWNICLVGDDLRWHGAHVTSPYRCFFFPELRCVRASTSCRRSYLLSNSSWATSSCWQWCPTTPGSSLPSSPGRSSASCSVTPCVSMLSHQTSSGCHVPVTLWSVTIGLRKSYYQWKYWPQYNE